LGNPEQTERILKKKINAINEEVNQLFCLKCLLWFYNGARQSCRDNEWQNAVADAIFGESAAITGSVVIVIYLTL
jgi:hypothetical protein